MCVGAGMPFLVACDARGKCWAMPMPPPYRPRSGYRFTLEDSIYVAPTATRRGIGRALLTLLIERCAASGYRQMVAVIGDSANAASIGLHERLGFAHVGFMPAIGFKLGRWVDSVLMQRANGPGRLGAAGAEPKPSKRKGPCQRHGPSLGRKRLEDVRQVVGRRPMPQCTM